MILHAITLSAWRCHVNELSLKDFSEGINVISGPNGVGKSTLFEALRRALMDSHIVTGQNVSAIRPWGRNLSPKVSVTFSNADTAYRISKQFMEGGFSLLERKENGRFQPLAEGRQADDQVRKMLSKTKPGRGFSQVKNWGLAQVLWAPQGDIRLAELSGDLAADIRSALGVQITDNASHPIELKINETYHQFFTSRGKTRTGKNAPPVEHLRRQLESARETLKKADEQFLRYEEASLQVETLQSQYRREKVETDECRKKVEEAREVAERFRELKMEETSRKELLEKTEAQYRQIQQHIETMRWTEKELAETNAGMIRMETDMPLMQKDLQVKEQASDAAGKDLIEIRNRSAAVNQAESDAESARRYMEVKTLHEKLSVKIRKAEAIRQMLDELKIQRRSVTAPDKMMLKTIANDIQERNAAQSRLDASLIHLEIIPETDGLLETFKEGHPVARSLSAGCPTVVKGHRQVTAEIKGVARLTARGPEGDADQLYRIIRETEDRIRENTRPYGTADIDRLEELMEAALALDGKIKDAQKEHQLLLGNNTPDALVKENERLEREVTALEQARPEWTASAPDAAMLKATASEMKQAYQKQVSTAESAWEQAQGAAFAAREQFEIAGNRFEDLKKSLEKIQIRLESLTRDGRSLADSENDLNRILLEQDAGKAALKHIEKKLEAFGDDPFVTLSHLEKRLAELVESVQKKRDDERTALGILETLAGQSIYSALVEAKEEVSRLEHEIQKQEMRMNAISLLYNTVLDCRAEAVASVSRTVEKTATRMLHRIAGSRIGHIGITDSFQPAHVSPETAGGPVDLVNLSGGEQEQLYLATRLALAEILAGSERQMVVLDDVLTATDSGRLDNIMGLLKESAKNLQILILTCHPKRYRPIVDPRYFFDLEALIHQTQPEF